MLWKKIKIKTSVKATDIVASVLFDNEIVGAEIVDNQNLTSDELKKMYVDIPKICDDDGKAYVIFYVSIDSEENIKKIKKNIIDTNTVDNSYVRSNDNIFTYEEFNSIIDNIKNELNEYKNFMDMGELTISEENIDDEIFLNEWKKNFKRFNIGNICIIPNFDNDEVDENKTNIYIEPGSAFGTGKHETTKLCIEFLKELILKNNINSMIDIGCGSGILGIIAYKLGIKNILSIDIDKSIENNLIENMRLNDIKNFYKIDNSDYFNDGFAYGFGNLIDDISFRNVVFKNNFDLITINILAPIIIKHIEDVKIYNYLNKNGHMILSGILNDQVDNIKSYIKNIKLLTISDVKSDGEWASILIKRIED